MSIASSSSSEVNNYKNETPFYRCGTVRLLNQLNEAQNSLEKMAAIQKTLARPTKNTYRDSEHFRVHYDTSGSNAPSLTDKNSNGTPDYVDSTLVYLEYAWNIAVVELGYGSPRSDSSLGGGSGIIDCYINELSGDGIYGMTSPDLVSGSSSSSYMTVDNNFTDNIYPTKGYDALKITTAHEFFHMIHYTYYPGTDAGWWMEHSSVWFEDRCWDSVNDYFNYLSEIFYERDKPLDTYDNSFPYGAAVFAMFIAENYGESYIRSVWVRFRDKQNGKIENLNAILPDGLSKAISDMSVWLYFTGSRGNSDDFYRDSEKWEYVMQPEYDIKLISSDRDSSLSFERYTFKYVDLTSSENFAYGDSVYYRFTNPDNGTWERKLIFYQTPNNYEIVSLSSSSGAEFIPRPFEKVILALTNASQSKAYYDTDMYFHVIKKQGVEETTAPEPFAIHQNYPNPFNNSTNIVFSLIETTDVNIKIYNSLGQLVDTLKEGTMGPGSYIRSYSASAISSGTYFVVLCAGGKTKSVKMTLLK